MSKTCVLCQKPIYRPQLICGGPVLQHWNCITAATIAPPLPTPHAAQLKVLIPSLVTGVKPHQFGDFGALLQKIDEAEYEESRGNKEPILKLKHDLEKLTAG